MTATSMPSCSERAGHRRQVAERGRGHPDMLSPIPASTLWRAIAIESPADPQRVDDTADAVVDDDDVGRLGRRGASAGPERDPDVGGGERGRVVDPVADHCDRAATPGSERRRVHRASFAAGDRPA